MGKNFKLKNGSLLVSTEASGGLYNSQQLKKLAELCERDDTVIKATEDQRLALMVTEEKLEATTQELSQIGLGTRHYQQGCHQPVNCVGALCPFQEQDAMQTSLNITEELAGMELDNPLRIGVNGCSRSCVPTHTLDISIVGDSAGYRMSLGGKNTQIPELAMFMAEGIPADELPALVRKVAEVYRDHAQEDESLHDLIERQGSGMFAEALLPYSQDGHTESSPLAAGLDAMQPVDQVASEEASQPETLEPAELSPRVQDDEPQLLSSEDVEQALQDFSPVADLASGNDSGVDIDPSDFNVDSMLTGDVAEVRVSEELEDLQTSVDDAHLDETIGEAPLAAKDLGDESALTSGFEVVEEQTASEVNAGPALEEELLDTIGESFEDSNSIASLESELLDHEPELIEYELDDESNQPDQLTGSSPEAPTNETVDASAENSATDLGPVATDAVSNQSDNPAASLESASLLEDDLEVLSDADADAFEERLESSIAQEEEISSEINQYDRDQEDRLETVSFVEAAALEDSDQEISLDDDFDDDSIASELMEQSLALSESAGFNQHFADSEEYSKQNEQAHFTFDVDLQGRGVLVFENGLQLLFDPSRFAIGAVKHMNLHGARLRLSCLPQGLEIDVDGITMLVPYDSSQSA